MKLKDELINYPTPIFAISTDGLVVAKNYLAEKTFHVVHIGATASRYTNIDFSIETFSRGEFCGEACSYFTKFDKIESTDVTLLFVSFSVFGEELLPYNILETYKQKIDSLDKPQSESKDTDRRYIRHIHDNIVKVNNFTQFSRLFEAKLNNKRIKIDGETTSLTQICTAINTLIKNYFEALEINVNSDSVSENLIAEICNIDMLAIFLNTLAFCIMNSKSAIDINLSENNNIAELNFKFKTNPLFDRLLDPNDNSVLNSCFDIFVAFELAKTYGYECSITKSKEKSLSAYTILYKIPAIKNTDIIFSASNSVTKLAEKLLMTIFFDEPFN